MISFDVLTLFPEFVAAGSRVGVLGRAVDAGILAVRAHQLRDYTGGSHRTVDDSPYGGGPGMVMQAEPLLAADRGRDGALRALAPHPARRPQGAPFTQARRAARWRRRSVDPAGLRPLRRRRRARASARRRGDLDRRLRADRAASSARWSIIDAVSRLVPGVLGNAASPRRESFSDRPARVPAVHAPGRVPRHDGPAVLRSGNHAAIARWRREQALLRTARAPPRPARRRRRSTSDEPRLAMPPTLRGVRSTSRSSTIPSTTSTGAIVTTAVTNIDVHDIARSCRAPSACAGFYVVTPVRRAARAGRAASCAHWEADEQKALQPDPQRGPGPGPPGRRPRGRRHRHRERATAAVPAHDRDHAPGPCRGSVTFPELRRKLAEDGPPWLMLLGTGYGLADQVVQRCEAVLEPIGGPERLQPPVGAGRGRRSCLTACGVRGTDRASSFPRSPYRERRSRP